MANTVEIVEENTIVEIVKDNINIEIIDEIIDIIEVGIQGPPGPPGVGMPRGGLADEFLKKNSDLDYDCKWEKIRTRLEKYKDINNEELIEGLLWDNISIDAIQYHDGENTRTLLYSEGSKTDQILSGSSQPGGNLILKSTSSEVKGSIIIPEFNSPGFIKSNEYGNITSGHQISSEDLKDVIAGDSDKLDGQDGTYYLDWGNFTNIPIEFTPIEHDNDYHTVNYITLNDVTYSNLFSLGLIGGGANQLAVGNHNHNSLYLGINDKANDSDLLDGKDSSYYTDAININYDNEASNLKSSTVQGAIDEITDTITNITASDISYDNEDSNLDADNVQEAIDIISYNLDSHNHNDLYYTKAEIDQITERKIFYQSVPSLTWVLNHNLNSYPNIIIIDSAGSVIDGAVSYQDLNTAIVQFNIPVSGIASII